MEWNKGYTARYIMTLVNPDTWTDYSEHEFTSGSISKSTDTTLVESASLSMTELVGDGENYIRVYLEASQTGDSARVPLFTGLTSTPERKLNGNLDTYSVTCYSVLKPVQDIILPRGYYAPIGSGANLVKELLSATPAPVEIEGTSPITTESIVASDGDNRLEMISNILTAINWQMVIKGDGTIVLREYPTEPEIRFGANQNDCIEVSVTDTQDWFSCPNVLMCISENDGAATVRDDDPDSELSTVSRGREIWQCETGVTLSNSETIAAYTQRRLKELQEPSRTLSYTRRYFPNLVPGDVVTLNYPGQRLDGNFRITSQSITLGYACKTQEEVTQIE